MSVLNEIDFDKILRASFFEIGIAISGWLNGQLLEEVALMSRITERLSRQRNSCDVGIELPVSMDCKVHKLHRRGLNQTDKYGSDLAITVTLNGSSIFLKTALFQLKKSTNLRVGLEKEQLQDALIEHRIAERSFVFAVDESRQCTRIAEIEALITQYNNQKTKQFDTSEWMGLSQWLLKWLSCEIGKPSVPGDPHSVESLLQSFLIEPPVYDAWTDESLPAIPEDYLPARAWVQMKFEKKEK